jgi:hypothetical protein
LKIKIKTLIGLLLGAAGGFAYYYFIGCQSGSCPITANPYISTVYGSVIGVLLVSGNKNKKDTETN